MVLLLYASYLNYAYKTHDIVIGPEDPRGHITQKYTNTIIGRYANRIPIGTHSIERNGVKAEIVAQLNGSIIPSLDKVSPSLI